MSKPSAAQGSLASAGGTDPAVALTIDHGTAAAEDWAAALAVGVNHAHRGNTRAQAEIDRCFVNGWGVARDVDLALKWLLPAAKAGDPLGQSLLGDFYFNGVDGPPQRSIAEEWYARAAKQGDAHAQDMLSWLLTDGDHRQPDFGQAMHWALQAAEQGAPLRHRLLYMPSQRDVAVAPRWWRKAARLGDGDGQAMLGAAHHLGAGAERNPVTALAWLIRARTLRSKFTDRFYDGVRNSCTPEQRREAERRACLPIEAEETSL